MTTQTHPARTKMEAEERYRAAIAENVRRGWRIESETPEVTRLVRGRPVNHILHLLLSVFTLGLWIPVWILVTILGGEDHHTVTRPVV